MYVVKAKNAADSGWTTIYDSSDKALCLISQPKHSSEMNQPGSFDFTIYPDSNFYDVIAPMNTFVSAFEGIDAEHLDETFYGRVLTCEDDFYGTKNVSCEGALSFLKDATVGQVSTDENNSGREYQTSPQAFLQEQLTAYNAKVEDRKKLFYGGVSGITTSSAENFKIDDDQDFKSLLESQLIDVYGGFFKITRLQNGTHELWYVKNYGINVGTAQMIQIGQNILDKQKHATGEGVFTFIRPVGKDGIRLDDGVYHGVACNSSNGRSGLYPVGTDEASFNALYARYGFIEKTKSFEDCENSAALANSCNSYVRDYGLDALDKLPMSFDVKLVDFFNANPNVRQIELGANYILTVDSEGRETGFEGHTDGTPAQEGQEGLTLTVYSINREYENPENDSIVFYNATYLTAKDYSVILSSMTGSYSGSSGGGGSRSGLSGYLSSSEAEMKEEQAEESRKVEKRFIDDEDSIGMVVTITENGKVINAGGIWTEIVGTDKTLLQGTLDVDLVALRSGAVITAINNDTPGERNITIDFDRLNITGGTLINVINGDDPSTPGELMIKANKVSIDGSASLNGLFTVDNGGALRVRPMAIFGDSGNLITINNGKVSADTVQINSSGSLKFGDGTGTPSGFYVIDASTAAHIVKGFGEGYEDPNNPGRMLIPYRTVSSLFDDYINFNIAATQFYIDGVAAAYANAVNRVSWPTTPRTQSSFSVSVPGNPWNASTETGTTLNRIFSLSAGNFDTNYISTVDLTMSHNENGQAVTDGVVAKIDVDASGVYSAGQNSVNVSMGNWNNGVVTFSPSAGTGNSKTLVLSNISGSNTITANGNYSYEVMYEDEYGDDYSTGLTKSIEVNVPAPTNYIVTLRDNSTTEYTRYDTYDIYPDEEVYFYPGTWNGASYVPETTYPMKVVGHGGTCTFAFRYSTIGTQFQVHVNGVSSGLYGVLEYDDGYVYMRDAATGLDYARVYVADLV